MNLEGIAVLGWLHAMAATFARACGTALVQAGQL
jgi:hypothetical protein